VTTAAIPDGARVAVDTSAFIYYLERHPSYWPLADELFRRIVADRLSACASVLVLTELLVPYHRAGDAVRAAGVSRGVRTFSNLSVLPANEIVAERAALLRARYGLRSPDALHVATGLEDGADWFVTNDLKLKRVAAEGLNVWIFDENL